MKKKTLLRDALPDKKVSSQKLFVPKLKKTLLTSLFFFGAISAYAQNDLKSWNSLGLNLSLSKKTDLSIGHLRSYDINNSFINDFNQSSLSIDHDFTKRFSMSGGAVIGGFSSADGASRLTLRSTYKVPIADLLNWSNAIQGELHSSGETRYRSRIRYITRLTTKKRLDFIRLQPSVSYSLYYNIGGNPINYYDQNAAFAVQQTPDGFHRGRLSLNLNSKLTKNFSVSLYGMMQREFNLFSDDYHKINVLNPVSGKTVRSFNNYNVIGTSATFNFDLYKKKSKSKKNKNENSDLQSHEKAN